MYHAVPQTFRHALRPYQHERGAVLFLGEAGSPKMGTARQLDHRVGQYHWSSRLGVLDRLHMVRVRARWDRTTHVLIRAKRADDHDSAQCRF